LQTFLFQLGNNSSTETNSNGKNTDGPIIRTIEKCGGSIRYIKGYQQGLKARLPEQNLIAGCIRE